MGYLLILVAFLVQVNAWGFTKNDQKILDKKAPNIKFSEFKSFGEFNSFLRLCVDFDIPCGIEYRSNTDSLPHLVDEGPPIQGGSVRANLKAVVAQNLGYRWFVTKGVVNLVPREVLEDRLKYSSPLDRIIGTIDVVDMSADGAVFAIFQQARLRCRELSSSIDDLHHLRQTGHRSRTVTIHLSNISLREALNEVVRKDGHSVWGFYSTRSGEHVVGLVAHGELP